MVPEIVDKISEMIPKKEKKEEKTDKTED
jgi:uncharacterized spore protein YtfJ